MTPSEQARADALADAETLQRLALVEFRRGRGYSQEALRAAGRVRSIKAWSFGTPPAQPEWAIQAAQTAFRAVPGLRG